MKHLLFALLAALAFAFQPLQAQEFDHDHKLWTGVMAKHVKADRFDYAALKKDRGALDAYLAQLKAATPAQLASWTREQRYAFWINAYNANCIALVLGEYPVESIKDIGGWFTAVWDKRFIDMTALDPQGKGRKLSLTDIEHVILRPQFKDARVHAAINCASLSCPPLRAEAFVAARLNEQLDDSVRRWLADATRNRFEPAKNRLQISAIFDWFKEDFEREGGVRAWIAKFAPPEHVEWLRSSAKLELATLDYSWKLNDVVKAK
jgi:hypothetical protein